MIFNFFNHILNFLSPWHRISKHKVPKWVRSKLYHKEFVRDGDIEYKKEISFKVKTYTNGQPEGSQHYDIYSKKIKKEKFYYKKLK